MSWDYFRDIRGEFDSRAWRAANGLASLYCDEGRFAEAAAFHAYGRGEHIGSELKPSWLSVEALLTAHEGRLDKAAEVAAQLTDAAETRGRVREAAECLATAARVQRLAGRIDEAERSAARALALFEQNGNLAGAARLRAALAQPAAS